MFWALLLCASGAFCGCLALEMHVVERKYVLSVVWPVAAKVLDAATRKSALSKNLRFLLILDFSRVSSSVPKMCLSWVHISPG